MILMKSLNIHIERILKLLIQILNYLYKKWTKTAGVVRRYSFLMKVEKKDEIS